jgi:predicted Zn finger-like uncharacterized protein
LAPAVAMLHPRSGRLIVKGMAEFDQRCPHCQTRYKIGPDHTGKRIRCAKCGKEFRANGGPPPPPEPAKLSRMPLAISGLLGVTIGVAAGFLLATQLESPVEPMPDQAAVESQSVETEIENPPEPAESGSLSKLVIANDGLVSRIAPEDWRIVEGRILGMQSGNFPQFPYLPGDSNLGLSRKALIEALRKEFPALSVEDGSNGATGEQCAVVLEPNFQVLMLGTWQNVHRVVVTGGWPASTFGERKMFEFALASEIAARVAVSDFGESDPVDSTWIVQALKESRRAAKELRKDDGDIFYSASYSLIDWDTDKQASLWFTVGTLHGPTGLREARGETEE